MRIGIDARMYRSSIAGIGRYSQNLIHNLLEIDSENEYVLFMTSADAEELRDKKREIRNKNYKIVETNISHFSLAEQTKLSKIIDKENIDLMHFLNFNHPIGYKKPFVVTVHDLTLLFYPDTAKKTSIVKQWGFKKVIKTACQNSEKIIAVSKVTKKDIVKNFRISESKIDVIYEAADDRVFFDVSQNKLEDLKQKYHLGSGKIILYVGQFRKHKNIDGLVQAFKILNEDLKSKLVMVGNIPLDTSTGSVSTLSDNRRVDKKGISRDIDGQDIVFPGFVDDEELACWYKLADVFVFPSFYEGFGLPGLEAMSAETPVVAANNSCLPEIYKDGALYFDPFKPSEIAGKLKEVLVDENLQAKLIQNGSKISHQYSWRKTAEETLKVYKEIQN